MRTSHTSWYFGTARLNPGLLLDFANKVNFLTCTTMTWDLKPKRALEHFICNWYSMLPFQPTAKVENEK